MFEMDDGLYALQLCQIDSREQLFYLNLYFQGTQNNKYGNSKMRENYSHLLNWQGLVHVESKEKKINGFMKADTEEGKLI